MDDLEVPPSAAELRRRRSTEALLSALVAALIAPTAASFLRVPGLRPSRLKVRRGVLPQLLLHLAHEVGASAGVAGHADANSDRGDGQRHRHRDPSP
jgi:hypothetical protein